MWEDPPSCNSRSFCGLDDQPGVGGVRFSGFRNSALNDVPNVSTAVQQFHLAEQPFVVGDRSPVRPHTHLGRALRLLTML